MQGIQGRVAVVTGAAQGNGRAIATGLAQAGAHVVCCDLQVERVEELAASLRGSGLTAAALSVDVSAAETVKGLTRDIEAAAGKASILVNNAGIIRRTTMDSQSFEQDWHAVLAVNATGTMNMVRALLPHLKENEGRIVNLASIMAVSAGPGLSAYAASKGAVLQLTRALAHDLAPFKIRVNAIAPGVIETPMTETTRNNPEALSRFMAHTPMGRVGRPEELVGPVLFLASDASSYVTGAMLPVDGGYLAA